MTLYDVYDICDIANESSINETWSYVKNKVTTFLRELGKQIREFGSQIIQSLGKLKEKIKKDDAFDISRVNTALNEQGTLKDVQNIIKRAENLEKNFDEVTDDVLKGNVSIDDCDTSTLRNEVNNIHKSLDVTPNDNNNTGTIYFSYS